VVKEFANRHARIQQINEIVDAETDSGGYQYQLLNRSFEHRGLRFCRLALPVRVTALRKSLHELAF
jgi:hypothetical protein